jgi:hypothetical protein
MQLTAVLQLFVFYFVLNRGEQPGFPKYTLVPEIHVSDWRDAAYKEN